MAISVTPSAVNQSAIASKRAGERGERAGPLAPSPPAWSGGPHAGHHLVLADVDPRAPLDQHVHQRPPHHRDHPGRDRRGPTINDPVKRARGQQFEVPGRPLASVSNKTGSRTPSENEHGRPHPDSHPSRRPRAGAMGSLRTNNTATPGTSVTPDATEVTGAGTTTTTSTSTAAASSTTHPTTSTSTATPGPNDDVITDDPIFVLLPMKKDRAKDYRRPE